MLFFPSVHIQSLHLKNRAIAIATMSAHRSGYAQGGFSSGMRSKFMLLTPTMKVEGTNSVAMPARHTTIRQ